MVNTLKLRRAINSGDANAVGEILRAVPKEDVRLTKGWTPLHTAIKRGHRSVVVAIIDTGADVNAITEMYETPLDLAVRYENEQVAELLRKKGARLGAELSLPAAIAAGSLKFVKKHVAAGADINQLANAELPLSLALRFRHWNVAKFLMTPKCDVTKTQETQDTPLHVAAFVGAPTPLLSAMLKRGAPIDATNAYGQTPLCCAAEGGHQETIDWLLDHGADVTHRRGESTPVHWAFRDDHVEVASYLIDRGAKSTLREAIRCNHLARVRQLLNAGTDANDDRDPDDTGSPLGVAIWNASPEMVTLLLEFGADPNQQDDSGDTSLHDAVNAGSAKMVKVLLAHGADPDVADNDGTTPIQHAIRRDRTHLANLMEAHLDKTLSLDLTQKGIEQLYTVQKVAELLSVDDSFVLELIKSRKIGCLKLDENLTRIPAVSVQRYLAKLAARNR